MDPLTHQLLPAADRRAAAVPPIIEVTSHRSDEFGGVRLAIVGEIDIATADVFAVAMADALDEMDHVVVDLTGVTFMDSTGLSALIHARTTCGESRRLDVHNPNPQVARLFEVTGLTEIFLTATSVTVGDDSGR